MDRRVREFHFPVGYHSFHKSQVFNFQLNRWLSLGYARYEDMAEVGPRIASFGDWKREMVRLAEHAVAEGRTVNAAFYYRAAEFYTQADDPDKELLYDRFAELFNSAYGSDGIERIRIPYRDKSLPVMCVSAATPQARGTILMHGGFDSFIEEFYSWMCHFAQLGYNVVGFEGPGQGAARRKQSLAFEPAWEKPVGAVLDHLELTDVTLLGISMGGWLCFRAAAFEPRIKRVIASGVAYDYMQFAPLVAQWLFKLFTTRFRGFTIRQTRNKMLNDPMHMWTLSQLMYMTKQDDVLEAMKAAQWMNAENLHSERVAQDVLILTGREDHFIPFKMHKMQVKALVNARTVTERVFTRDESAQNHCQIGNVRLALSEMTDWLSAHA
jgi:pimeloyl-ACP methyl ester carboxylesterase